MVSSARYLAPDGNLMHEPSGTESMKACSSLVTSREPSEAIELGTAVQAGPGGGVGEGGGGGGGGVGDGCGTGVVVGVGEGPGAGGPVGVGLGPGPGGGPVGVGSLGSSGSVPCTSSHLLE